LRLSVTDLVWYAVALLDMRKFITQLGIFTLLLFHFGCSGVQQRTAFGGGFDQESYKVVQNLDSIYVGSDELDSFNISGDYQEVAAKGPQKPFLEEKVSLKKPTFKEFKRERMNKLNTLKYAIQQQKFLKPFSKNKKSEKQGAAYIDWSGYSLFLLVGLVAALVAGICYLGLTYEFLGTWKEGYLTILLFLLSFLISIVSLFVGLVMYLYSII
jgi:hypothetical protein